MTREKSYWRKWKKGFSLFFHSFFGYIFIEKITSVRISIFYNCCSRICRKNAYFSKKTQETKNGPSWCSWWRELLDIFLIYINFIKNGLLPAQYVSHFKNQNTIWQMKKGQLMWKNSLPGSHRTTHTVVGSGAILLREARISHNVQVN